MISSFVVRVLLGGLAAALSVVIFHQGMFALLHVLAIPGLEVPAPYSMAPVAPYGVPRLFDLCFWGGLYGLVFGAILPVVWLSGLALGVVAAMVGMFIVTAIKGLPVGNASALAWVRSLLINGAWGIGVGLILPVLIAWTSARSGGPQGVRAG
jgi:hypothetical protein